jgi:hypothetical protein
MTFNTWFPIVWVALVAVMLRRFVVHRRREAPFRELIHSQPVVFTTRAAVLIRAREGQGIGWGSLSGAGWPELLIHPGGLEVTIGAFDGLISRNTMLLEGATMRRDRLGVLPLVGGSHDCIRICGTNGDRPREWKVAPRGTPIDEVWAQLIAAGVTPLP